jgi:hypothetical protein
VFHKNLLNFRGLALEPEFLHHMNVRWLIYTLLLKVRLIQKFFDDFSRQIMVDNERCDFFNFSQCPGGLTGLHFGKLVISFSTVTKRLFSPAVTVEAFWLTTYSAEQVFQKWLPLSTIFGEILLAVESSLYLAINRADKFSVGLFVISQVLQLCDPPSWFNKRTNIGLT